MPVTYYIDKERRLITSTLTGFVSLETLVAYRNQLVADPEFNARFDVLLDFRQVTCYEITPEEIQGFVGKPVVSPARRRAFVVRDKSKLNPLLARQHRKRLRKIVQSLGDVTKDIEGI